MAESIADLERLWEQAGGSVASAPDAAAIAMAESGGNPVDHNSSDPNGGSFGLWQINGVHADDMKAAGLPNWQTDPLQNAEAAVMIWKGQKQNFFTSGGWLAEAPGYPGNANYLAAKAKEASGDIGTTTYPQNPFQRWMTQTITGQSGANAGTATAPVAGQAGAPAGQQATTAVTADPFGLGAGISTIQTSWAAFWVAHPAWVILAGLVLLGIAWSLVGAPNIASVAPQAPQGAAHA